MKFLLIGILAVYQIRYSVSSEEASLENNEVHLKSDYAQQKSNEAQLRADALWNSWKDTHSKNYLTTLEENRRRKNFEEKVDLMNQHNERFEKGEVPFKLSVYGFADRTRDEFLRLRTGLSVPLRLSLPTRTSRTTTSRTTRSTTSRTTRSTRSITTRSRRITLFPTTETVSTPASTSSSSTTVTTTTSVMPFSSDDNSTTSTFSTTESVSTETSTQALTENFSWVALGKVTPVKDQGQCGACWAFASVAALESRYLIQQNITLDLSEQTVLSCDRLSGNQCGGGWPYSAMTGYMKSNGVTTEKSYPYVARNTLLCQRNTAWKFYKSAGETEPYMLNGDENALKNLVLKSPVVVGIYASQKFQLYHSGILVDDLCDSSSSPNHAVLVTGYGTVDGLDYWEVKNSWGTAWGEKGYVRMVRNKNNLCKIASYGAYPTI